MFKKTLALLLGLAGIASAGPAGPPAGNYLLNVSTIAAKPAFNVSSGTVRDQLKLGYGTQGNLLYLDPTGIVTTTTTVPAGGDVFKASTQTFTAPNTFASSTTFNKQLRVATTGAGQGQGVGGSILVYATNETGMPFQIYSSSANQAGFFGLINLINSNTNYANAYLYVNGASSATGKASAYFTDPNPNIQFVQTGVVSPAGQYEFMVLGDTLQFRSMNAGGSAYKPRVGMTHPGALVLYETSDNGHYVALMASATVPSNVTWVMPAADGTAGQVLTTDGNKNFYFSTASGGGAGVTVYPATATASFPFGLSTSSAEIPSGYLSDKLSFTSSYNTALFSRDAYHQHAQLNSSLGVGFGDYYYISSSTGTPSDAGAFGGIIRLGPGSEGSYLGYGNSVTGPTSGFNAGPAFNSVIGLLTLSNGVDVSSTITISGSAGTNGQVLTSAGVGAVPTWTTVSGGGSGVSLSTSIAQTGHGFAVQDVVMFNGSSWVKAQADNGTDAEVVGIVSAVADVNNFTLLTSGRLTGLSGLSAGSVYFLSPTSAGALTATEPSTVGQISKPLLVADASTSGYFNNWRGQVVGSGGGGGGSGSSNLSGYRRAYVQYYSTISVHVDSNTSTANQSQVVFVDGSTRTITAALSNFGSTRVCNLTVRANWGNSPVSGMAPGETVANDTTYNFYAVKSTTTVVDFSVVATTTPPTSPTALDAAFASGGWMYLGVTQYRMDVTQKPHITVFSIHNGIEDFSREKVIMGHSIDEGSGLKLYDATGTKTQWNYATGVGASTSTAVVPPQWDFCWLSDLELSTSGAEEHGDVADAAANGAGAGTWYLQQVFQVSSYGQEHAFSASLRSGFSSQTGFNAGDVHIMMIKACPDPFLGAPNALY